ncbi:hypothetical protein DSUL_50350 [Desulfovibrionales bacterium]
MLLSGRYVFLWLELAIKKIEHGNWDELDAITTTMEFDLITVNSFCADILIRAKS